MAFLKFSNNNSAVDSPETLFRDLHTKTVQGLLSQQADILREYMKNKDKSDIALELPTGSGKTLVGLLIAEWRRRSFAERCLFLCPTIQLVYQAAEQAKNKYGINVLVFIGSKQSYSSDNQLSYQNCEKIGITTYSSLFNSKPFFTDVHTIIFDDAHAAENYVSKCWSVEINRYENESLFNNIKNIIYNYINDNDKLRLDHNNNYCQNIDLSFVNKLPSPIFFRIKEDLLKIIDSNSEKSGFFFQWQMIRNNFHSCHFFYNNNSFLIRPIIPPTSSFQPFVSAKQRIYMSATLGNCGDLERIFGRKKIVKIYTPNDFNKQGIGRRFILFPMKKLDKNSSINNALGWISKFSRALILTPSENDSETFVNILRQSCGYTLFSNKDINMTKELFTKTNNAIAVLSNRYDGIDFSEDECRYLIIYELPEATNLQERFFIHRLGVGNIYSNRINTRITQALGRCVRSSTDWSLVCVIGEKINKYIMSPEKRSKLPLELQAEIDFGIKQSSIDNYKELSENIDSFIKQDDDWNNANNEIILYRNSLKENKNSDIEILLENIVEKEIDYANYFWNSDFKNALLCAENISSMINIQSLRGYRGFWLYLAGNASYLKGDLNKAGELYKQAAEAVISLSWLQNLSEYCKEKDLKKFNKPLVMMIDNIYQNFESITKIDKLNKLTDKIKEEVGLKEAKHFENSQLLLGKLLGFQSFKTEESGAADPYWVLPNNKGIIFEDFTDIKSETKISKEKVLQADGHQEHIKYHKEYFSYVEFKSILCSPSNILEKSAEPHTRFTYYISVESYVEFTNKSLIFIKELWDKYNNLENIPWHEYALKYCIDNKLSPDDIISFFTQTKLEDLILTSK